MTQPGSRFTIRAATGADVDALYDVAGHLATVNLPHDRERIAAIVSQSERSFAGRLDAHRREFMFVLEGDAPGVLAGCSMVFAQHGSRKAPHVFFDVGTEERYSETLDRLFVHTVLRIGYDYQGVTEIGGLVLRPHFRGHPARLGKLLSFVRFVYIALHRADFKSEIVSELMPPLEPDGTSLLWESLGRRFTGLSYQQADQLSRENKEFIRTLFPHGPIYATLLSPEAQALIGQVGPATQGVEHMLRAVGFRYANRIDPFDGGPHFHARTDDVTLVRATRKLRVEDVAPVPARVAALDGIVAHRLDEPPYFRAARGQVGLVAGHLIVPPALAKALDLQPGADVGFLPWQ